MEHGEETMTIVDENGVEHVCEVIFTFESKDYGKSYVLYHVLGEDEEGINDDDEEIEIHASSFIPGKDGEEGGELSPIDDDEEWEMVQETFNTFVESEDEDEDEE